METCVYSMGICDHYSHSFLGILWYKRRNSDADSDNLNLTQTLAVIQSVWPDPLKCPHCRKFKGSPALPILAAI